MKLFPINVDSNITNIKDATHSPKATWVVFKFFGQNFSINIASKAYDNGIISAYTDQIFNERLLLRSPNSKIKRPTNPDKVPKINFIVTSNNLKVQTINSVKTGTIEIIKVNIPASILGATINSIERGTI